MGISTSPIMIPWPGIASQHLLENLPQTITISTSILNPLRAGLPALELIPMLHGRQMYLRQPILKS